MTKENSFNPFLKKDGSLFNPYINYQKVIDNPFVLSKTKELIQNATGLSPSQSTKATQSGNTASVGAVSLPASGSNIVNAAQSYIGTPYVWGGESMTEGGMDCSGFVYNALKDAGYDVGRDTAQGYRKYGTSVNKSDMQPGDLVFFGSNGKATHIGIYAGDGKMIHSSGDKSNTKSNPGKGVSVVNVDYRSDFLEARRY